MEEIRNVSKRLKQMKRKTVSTDTAVERERENTRRGRRDETSHFTRVIHEILSNFIKTIRYK